MNAFLTAKDYESAINSGLLSMYGYLNDNRLMIDYVFKYLHLKDGFLSSIKDLKIRILRNDSVQEKFKNFKIEFLNKNQQMFKIYQKNKIDLYKIHLKGKYKDNEIESLALLDCEREFNKRFLKEFKLQLENNNIKISNKEWKEIKEGLDVAPSQQEYFNLDWDWELKAEEFYGALIHRFELNTLSDEIIEKYKDNIYNVKTINGERLDVFYSQGTFTLKSESGKEDVSFLLFEKQIENNQIKYVINIRGTELSVKKMSEWISEDYINMANYQWKIQAVLDDVIEKIMESNNGKNFEIEFSGHSLGANAAKKLYENYKNKYKDNSNLTCKCVLLASPGGDRYGQKIKNWIDITKGSINRNGKFAAFKHIGLQIVDKTFLILEQVVRFSDYVISLPIETILTKYKDPNLISIKRENDFVPKIGRLINQSIDNTFVLKKSKEDKIDPHKTFGYVKDLLKEYEEKFPNDFLSCSNSMKIAKSILKEKPYMKKLYKAGFIEKQSGEILANIAKLRQQTLLAGSDFKLG